MYYICWRSRLTGTTGRGVQSMARRNAELWAQFMNTQYPDFEHWIEPA